jgi:hypothetical protein
VLVVVVDDCDSSFAAGVVVFVDMLDISAVGVDVVDSSSVTAGVVVFVDMLDISAVGVDVVDTSDISAVGVDVVDSDSVTTDVVVDTSDIPTSAGVDVMDSDATAFDVEGSTKISVICDIIMSIKCTLASCASAALYIYSSIDNMSTPGIVICNVNCSLS